MLWKWYSISNLKKIISKRHGTSLRHLTLLPFIYMMKNTKVGSYTYILRASGKCNHVTDAKRFEGVFLCKNVC